MSRTRKHHVDYDRVCDLWGAGLTSEDIGLRLGITPVQVVGIIALCRKERGDEAVPYQNDRQALIPSCPTPSLDDFAWRLDSRVGTRLRKLA